MADFKVGNEMGFWEGKEVVWCLPFEPANGGAVLWGWGSAWGTKRGCTLFGVDELALDLVGLGDVMVGVVARLSVCSATCGRRGRSCDY